MSVANRGRIAEPTPKKKLRRRRGMGKNCDVEEAWVRCGVGERDLRAAGSGSSHRITYSVDRLEIRFVCHPLARLHRCNIRVDQHNLNVLLFQRLDGLRAAVVKLSSLPDGQAAGSEQQHLVDDRAIVPSGRHECDA